MAEVAIEMKNHEQAEDWLLESLTILEPSAPHHWQTFHTRLLLAKSLLGQHKYEQVEALYPAIKSEVHHHRNNIVAAKNSDALILLRQIVADYEESNRAG